MKVARAKLPCLHKSLGNVHLKQRFNTYAMYYRAKLSNRLGPLNKFTNYCESLPQSVHKVRL